MLGASLRADRLRRFQRVLSSHGYGGAVVFASGRHQMLSFAPSNYLGGFLPAGDAAFLIPAEDGRGAPEVVVTPRWEAVRIGDIAPYYLHGVNDVTVAMLGWANRLMGRDNWVMIGADRMVFTDWEQLAAVAPLRRDDKLLERLSDIKDEGELALIRRAAEIADAGFEALFQAAAPGVAEYDLVAEMDYAMDRLGAHDNFGLIASGKNITSIRVATGRRLKPGDLIICEITPAYHGYFAQICRTIVVGDGSLLLREKLALLREALTAALAAAKPGRPVSDIPAAMNRVFIEQGYEMYTRPPYMRIRGHGLGMGSPAPGGFNSQNHRPLEVGMTMVVHPNQVVPETGYLMLGDTVEITPQGAQSLSRIEHRLYEKPC